MTHMLRLAALMIALCLCSVRVVYAGQEGESFEGFFGTLFFTPIIWLLDTGKFSFGLNYTIAF